MNRASPVDLRKAIEAAHTFVNAGILFVPMPVLSEKDHEELLGQMHGRMQKMMDDAEKEGRV